jgi:nucleotide-binding universal stress UspA family protein
LWGVNSISLSARTRGFPAVGRPPRLIGAGVDGSPSARDAAAFAAMLAERVGAALMLIGVHEEPLVEFVSPTETGWTARQQQVLATLMQTRDSLAPEARITVQPDVLVWRALCHVARREHRDVLVVGAGRRAREGHVGLGSRAAELLERLECPLAIVPRGMRARERRLERIGVGFEDEPNARAAVELAESIARASHVELVMCAAIDDRTSVGLPSEDLVPVGESIAENQARLLRDRAHAAVAGSDVTVRVEVSSADPADALSALAADVDLLVIGSRRSGPARVISLGSTGRAMAGGASCPILVAPGPSLDAAG